MATLVAKWTLPKPIGFHSWANLAHFSAIRRRFARSRGRRCPCRQRGDALDAALLGGGCRRRGVHDSIEQLEKAVLDFIELHNGKEAKPFNWTASSECLISVR